MKKKVPSWIILTCICLVVGGALGAVNEITWELIAQRAAEQAEADRRGIFAFVPTGQNFCFCYRPYIMRVCADYCRAALRSHL